MSFSLDNYPVGSIVNFTYPCGNEKTDCHPLEGYFPKGTYKLELWGAEGGRAFNQLGGYGGYSTGKITFSSRTRAFLYIGAQGPSTTSGYSALSKKAFNGGGSGRQSHDTSYMASSGGGSTDIRLLEDDVYHRLIISGGGGGPGNYAGYKKGGDGGGENGGNAASGTGYGANQTSGTLLNGADITNYDGCGGGGGLYGGKNGYGGNGPGGGGSGFVFSATKTEVSSAAGIKLSSKYYLTESYTSLFAHTEDGLIRITIVSSSREYLSCKRGSKGPSLIFIYIFNLVS